MSFACKPTKLQNPNDLTNIQIRVYIDNCKHACIGDGVVQAMLDMLRILTAILALGLGAFLFNRDATRLVLVPIERMMQKVRSGR